MITFTEKGAEKVREFLATQSTDIDTAGLRVGVRGGGCSGFQYGFALDDKGEPDDVLVLSHGAEVVVDGMSLMYLMGSELDFVEDLTGSYFRMNNPNASSSCGCGTSFSI